MCVVYILPRQEGVNPPGNYCQRANGQDGGSEGEALDKRPR